MSSAVSKLPRRGVTLFAVVGTMALLALASAATASAAPSADTFTVSVLTDSPHVATLDGTCTSQLMGGTCTLRAAVQAVNYLAAHAQPGPHTINLATQGMYTLTV